MSFGGTADTTIQRFTLNERLQHALLMLSTLVLLITGFSLLFHEVWIGRWLLWLEGGVQGRGLIHRWAAAVLIAVCTYHFLYVLFTGRGHAQFMHMRPRWQDIREFVQVMRLNLGRSAPRPAFDRFDYRQKFQYWAFLLAGASMIVSGLALWFATETLAVMPKWLFDLLAVLHGRESVVIFLVLFLWHLYDVHLRPEVFPMDWSWITGQIRLSDLRERHPLEYDRLRNSGAIDGDGIR
ncbi:MAG TPA: cytochrome b/b6 domain-containing protein [Candidatus Methylomirabilis sp.]|nr:cytochrome b/b6 domain-containing protein [Candidatus Methylomirabilis sp.]HSD50275.1 cytochrome b/b6 domain-containing protein [Candidatus Methylomirabilis sp.]